MLVKERSLGTGRYCVPKEVGKQNMVAMGLK